MVDETKAKAQQAGQDMKETAHAEARRTGETIKQEAGKVADEAKELAGAHAEQRFEQGKGVIEDQVDTIHSAVDGAARRLREENSPLASYANELSGQLARFSDGIENSSLDDLAVKTRRVARENPGLFVLGSVVAGIAAGRFFKASSSRDSGDYVDLDDIGGSDDGRSDDYRAGREAAMARYRTDYRSPSAGYTAPYRPGTDDGRVGDAGMGGAPRVPMDSTLATDRDTTVIGTTNNTTGGS